MNRTATTTFDEQLGWMPAIPLPFYLAFGRCRCKCGKTFWGESKYERHYALTHVEPGGQDISALERDRQRLLANLCAAHGEINLCSVGPCGMCRADKAEADLASQINCTAQLESNIRFLNERLERSCGETAWVRSPASQVLKFQIVQDVGVEWSIDVLIGTLEHGRVVYKTLATVPCNSKRHAMKSRDEMESLFKAALAFGETAWVSVEERLPESEGTVLIFRPFHPTGILTRTVGFRNGEFYCQCCGKGYFPHPITHWQPLPSPPTGRTEEK
jgi:hypothetical protein